MTIFHGFRLRAKSGASGLRPRPILPSPPIEEARERLRSRIVGLDKSPVERYQ